MTTVVAAVIERDGLVLIGQRKPTGQHPLRWEFPGGKVEPGEAPEAALARELDEELGIQARVGPEIMRYEYQYPGRPPILLIFYSVTRVRRRASKPGFRADRLGPARKPARLRFSGRRRRLYPAVFLTASYRAADR